MKAARGRRARYMEIYWKNLNVWEEKMMPAFNITGYISN